MGDSSTRTHTAREVGKTLRISEDAVYALCASGALRAVKVGRLWRVSEKNLQAFLDGR